MGPLPFDLFTLGRVLLQREVTPAIDPRLLRPSELRERVAAPDDEVAVLTRLQRTDLVVDGHGLGRLVGHGRKRLLFRESGAQQLARLPVHAGGDLVVVGV